EKFLSIFPNPFISSTTIQTIGNLKNASLTIYNSNGQTLKQIKNISEQTVSLTRDNLPSGFYYIRLTEENKIIALEKLIITD
ncbi:MAG: T9SS type A sorting domain-containing protein, partial [Crocinitomicaceae bacterium]|nr:T9SS type A sorting domain-containing protein [Crocinitomicaceae bacterium]